MTQHVDMQLEIGEGNKVSFTMPDGKTTTIQYPPEFTEDQIVADFKAKLCSISAVNNVSVAKVHES